MDLPTGSEQVQSTPVKDVLRYCERRKERFELLVLTEAGKPVYSYTKREDAVTLMPLCSALIDYAKKAQKETLKFLTTSDGLVINFATKPPLTIIVIHEVNSYVDPRLLVERVEAQIISILTAKTLQSVFEDRPTYDLKRLLYGSEKLIDATTNLCAFPKKLGWPWVEAFLATSMQNSAPNGPASSSSASNPSASLPTRPHRVLVPIVIVPPSIRDNIHSLIQNVIASNSKNIVFSLLFRIASARFGSTASSSSHEASSSQISDNEAAESDQDGVAGFELMTICNHHDRHKIKIADIHMTLALLSGSRAQLASVESLWLPVCLPKFNQDAFLHSYISYMNDNRHCLVMMSIDRDDFSNCQKSRNAIEEKLDALCNDASQKAKLYYQVSPLVHPSLLEMQDRLVSGSLTSEDKIEFEQKVQMNNIKQDQYHARQLQFLWYQTSKQVFWWQRSQQKSMNPVLYYVTMKMLQASLKHLWLKVSHDSIFMGWHMPSFQLYAQFDVTTTTTEATEVIQRVTNWIKKEEDNFSIKNYR